MSTRKQTKPQQQEIAQTEPTLAAMEAIIEKEINSFVRVGVALAHIERHPDWYENYGTFKEYALGRWGLGRSSAYRMIGAAKVVGTLERSPIGDTPPPPLVESQARELVPLLDEPDKLAEAWIEANREGKPTAETIRKAVQPLVTPKPKKARKSPYRRWICPTCNGKGWVETGEGDPTWHSRR